MKLNGASQFNPPRWPDGSYSVRGAAEALAISTVTVFQWLRQECFRAEQLAPGMLWQIHLTESEIATLKARIQQNSHSKKEAYYEIIGEPMIS